MRLCTADPLSATAVAPLCYVHGALRGPSAHHGVVAERVLPPIARVPKLPPLLTSACPLFVLGATGGWLSVTLATIGYNNKDVFFHDCGGVTLLVLFQTLLGVVLDATVIGTIYERLSRSGSAVFVRLPVLSTRPARPARRCGRCCIGMAPAM